MTMMRGDQTNCVYFSGLLPQRHPDFFRRLEKVLQNRNIAYSLLPNTQDIWCRDYMPLQVDAQHFVSFRYEPSYLARTAADRGTITNALPVSKALDIIPKETKIKLDGGNLIPIGAQVIITDRVLSENPGYSEESLISEIKNLLRVDNVIIIPECPGDLFGHADGMVRAVGPDYPDTVFCSDFSEEPRDFSENVSSKLSDAGLTRVQLPYAPYGNKTNMDAKGVYINYLQIGATVIYPIFGLKEDETARRIFEEYFGDNAIALKCNDIARKGGALHCVSWNIFRT